MLGNCFLNEYNKWVAEYPDAQKIESLTRARFRVNYVSKLLTKPGVIKIVANYGTDKQRQIMKTHTDPRVNESTKIGLCDDCMEPVPGQIYVGDGMMLCPDCYQRNYDNNVIMKKLPLTVKKKLNRKYGMLGLKTQTPFLDAAFIVFFKAIQKHHGEAMIAKGFHDKKRSPLEYIALMHTELAEMTEGYRHGNLSDDKIPQFSTAEAECADTILRIMDFAHAEKLRVAEALIAKIAHNATRPYKHGKTC